MTAGRRGRRCYQLGCHPAGEVSLAPLPGRDIRSARLLPACSPHGDPPLSRPAAPRPPAPGVPQSEFSSYSISLPSPTQPSLASRRAPSSAASVWLPGLPQPRALADPHLPCPGPHRRGRCITAERRPGTALQSRQRAPPCYSRAEPTSLASRLQLPPHAQRPRYLRPADRRMRLATQKFYVNFSAWNSSHCNIYLGFYSRYNSNSSYQFSAYCVSGTMLSALHALSH